MCVTNTCEPHVELAIDVFKSQTPALLSSLKDFLTVLPSPKCVEEVLALAIYKLADTDPDACRWLLRHPHYLQPELDLVELTMKLALAKLQNQGFVPGQDFRFESDGQLYMSERAKTKLTIGNSVGERLLLEEILQVHY